MRANQGVLPNTFSLFIGEFLQIQECKIESIPISKCLGIGSTHKTTKESGAAIFWPIPVAIKRGDMYEILPAPKFWKYQFDKAQYSQIVCLLLSDSCNKTDLNHAERLLHSLLPNRTLHSREDVYTSFFSDPMLSKSIQKAYGISSTKTMLKELLGANAFSDKQADRHKEKCSGIDDKAKKRWNEITTKVGGLSYNQVLNKLKQNEDKRNKAISYLNGCRNKSDNEIESMIQKINKRFSVSQEMANE